RMPPMPVPELSRLAPLTLLSTPVARGGILNAIVFVALVFADVPAGKYSTSPLMVVSNDGLKTRTSDMNVQTAPATGMSNSHPAGGDFPRQRVRGGIDGDKRRADGVAAGRRHLVRAFQVGGVVDDRPADRRQLSADRAAGELRGVHVDIEVFRMRDQRRRRGRI